MPLERSFRMILPKKGRLKGSFESVMADCGLTAKAMSERLDFGTTYDDYGQIAPFETLTQRCADALANIRDGLADMAVIGRDNFEEARCEAGNDLGIEILCEFNGCADCALWIAAPDSRTLENPQDLRGLRIATSYPNILKKWLQANDVADVTVIAREGGIEDYVRLGLADAVCDVVQSGETLAANGLRKNIKLFDSSAVLVAPVRALPAPYARQAALIAARLSGYAQAPSVPANRPATEEPAWPVAAFA